MKRANRSDGGFTLLEILLSLALVGLLLVAVNTFVFSMGELWGRNNDRRLFDQHVNAVTRFLQNTLRTASLPPAASANSMPIAPMQVTPAGGAADDLITFELPAGSRILVWPDRPLPEVVCSLQMREREGLYLLWHSRLEVGFDTDPPREMLLTPLVTGIVYDYYDNKLNRWETETVMKPMNSEVGPPQRLHLTFTYGKFTRQTIVSIPGAPEGMPDF